MATGSTSDMRESFVEDLLRMSVPLSPAAVWLRLNVVRWCTSVACKYNISVIVMAAVMTSQVQHWALRGLLALLQERFMSKWWL